MLAINPKTKKMPTTTAKAFNRNNIIDIITINYTIN